MAIDQDLQEIKLILRDMPGKVASAFGVLPGGQGPSPAAPPGAQGGEARNSGTWLQNLFPNSPIRLDTNKLQWNVPSPPPQPKPPPPPSPLNMSLLKGPIAPTLNMALLGPQPAPPPMNMNLLNPAPSPVTPSPGIGSSQTAPGTAAGTSPDLVDVLKDMIRELKTLTEAIQKDADGGDGDPAEKVPTKSSMWEAAASAAPGHERTYPPMSSPPTVMRPSRI